MVPSLQDSFISFCRLPGTSMPGYHIASIRGELRDFAGFIADLSSLVFRGFGAASFFRFSPTARAVGCILPSLRGCPGTHSLARFAADLELIRLRG